jgi:hypothetical protein
MSDVTIDLNDLKLLVDYCFEQDVHQRAQRSALILGAQNSPLGASVFAGLVTEATPEAEAMTALRYGDLRRALKSGIGIPAALSDFLGTAHKSPGERSA